MKIVLVLPSIIAADNTVIYAPKDLFISLANGLIERNTVVVFAPTNVKTKTKNQARKHPLEDGLIESIKDKAKPDEARRLITHSKDVIEYELSLTSEAFRFAEENDYDIVHVYSAYHGHYVADVASTPSVFTLHDPVFDEKTLEYNLIKNFTYHNYVFISQSQMTFYEKAYDIKGGNVVLHGIDSNKFEFSDNPKDEMAFIGRIIPSKGLDDALHTVIRLEKKLKVVTSKNYENSVYYKEDIKPLIDKSDKIRKVPFLNNQKELSEFYGSSKATLFPIKWPEAFGMVMVESMSCGTPVIAYNNGSVSELIRDGVTGYIINKNKSDYHTVIKETGIAGLARAIEMVYNSNNYLEMRRNCRKHVEENFTVEKMVEGYEEVYRKVIAQHKN